MTSIAASGAMRCTAWNRVRVSVSSRNKPDRPSDAPLAFTSFQFHSKTKAKRHLFTPYDTRAALLVKRGHKTRDK